MILPSDFLKTRYSVFYNEYVTSDIKIASVGDLHLSKLVGMKDIDRISRQLKIEKPHYIYLLGDLLDSPLELLKRYKREELKTLIKNCSSIAQIGVMIILASHDFIDESKPDYPDLINDTDMWQEADKIPGVHVLNDKTYQDEKIFIAGYRQKREAYYDLLNGNRENAISYKSDFLKHKELLPESDIALPKILLTHSPEPILNPVTQAIASHYDYIVTGHYHNGCQPIILDDIVPGHRGIITPKKSFLPKYARGIVRLDEAFYSSYKYMDEDSSSLQDELSINPNCYPYLVFNGGWIKIQDCAPQQLQWLDSVCYRQMDVTTLTSDEQYKEKPRIYSKRKYLNKGI